ncbi:MAG: site-2 protease family protein [Sulfolobaceae archaeon]
MNPYVIALVIFILFWIMIYALRNRLKKYGLEVYPLLLLWKRKSREEWFPKISRSKYYIVFDKFSIILGIISMIGGIYLIYMVLINLILSPNNSTIRLQPIIPLVTVGLDQLPYLLLSLSISVALHEIFHAISATSNNVKIKSGGILILGIFLGAFVEPDEKSFNSAPLVSKLKIISSGIALNLILSLLFLPIILNIPSLSQGALITNVEPNSPAFNSSIKPSYIILEINNQTIKTPQDVSKYLRPGSLNYITLLTSSSEVKEVSVYIPNSTGKLGVMLNYYFPTPLNWIIYFSIWMFNINLSLSLLNGAPLIITDGAKIFTEIMKRKFGELGERISFGLQLVIILSLVSAIYLSLISPLG